MEKKLMTFHKIKFGKITNCDMAETNCIENRIVNSRYDQIKRTVAVLLIAIMTACSFSVVSGGFTAAAKEKTPQKKVEIRGNYKDATAFVEINMTDPDSLEIEDKDYLAFLSELKIGNGLTIPLETEEDLTKMREIATSDAIRENEKEVQLKKAKKIDKKKVKKAEAEAEKKAKAQYDSIWNMPSEKLELPKDTDGSTKTYMDYKTVTAKGSPQYALLNSRKAYTEEGFRMYDGYYCIALGSFYGSIIGTKYYIELSNGRILKCILGDQKSDRHTDKNHQYAVKNKDVMEFIIDNKALPGGDVSAVPGFEGSIVSIKKIIGTDKLYQDFNAITESDIKASQNANYGPSNQASGSSKDGSGYNDSSSNHQDPSVHYLSE